LKQLLTSSSVREDVDKVRRDEVAELPELKGTRYHWLRDASDWSPAKVELHWLRMGRSQTARAWRMKEALRDILAWRRAPQVPVVMLMDRWIGWCQRSRLTPFKRLANTFLSHIEGIRNMVTVRPPHLEESPRTMQDADQRIGSRLSMSRFLVVGSWVRTSVSHACGSMLLALAVATKLMMDAARWPAAAEPVNNQFLRPSAMGRMAFCSAHPCASPLRGWRERSFLTIFSIGLLSIG
jgi:hypothetical protein